MLLGGKLLVDLVGQRRALEILLHCRKLDAEEASKVGLCDNVTRTNDLSETVDFLKGLVSSHDYRVTQAVKSICASGAEERGVECALSKERTFFAPLVGSEVHISKLESQIKH